jgi:hypothetical protein
MVRLPEPNRPQGSGPVSYVRSIRVLDANGYEFILHEFHDRRFLRKVRRMKLDTGELVDHVDDDTFVIVGTGERLTRITA